MIERKDVKPAEPKKAEQDDKVETKGRPPEVEMKVEPGPMGPRD